MLAQVRGNFEWRCLAVEYTDRVILAVHKLVQCGLLIWFHRDAQIEPLPVDGEDYDSRDLLANALHRAPPAAEYRFLQPASLFQCEGHIVQWQENAIDCLAAGVRWRIIPKGEDDQDPIDLFSRDRGRENR